MPRTEAKTITIRLLDGNLDGIRTAKIANALYEAIVFPRNRLGDLKTGKVNISRPGAYILVDESVEVGRRRLAYIGESSTDVYGRIVDHNKPSSSSYKEFWKTAIVLTSDDCKDLRTKAKFIEGELIRISEDDDFWKITNTNGSSYNINDLSDSDADFVNHFIENCSTIVNTLGYNLFLGLHDAEPKNLSNIKVKKPTKMETINKFFCYGKGKVFAEMQINSNGNITIKEGSIANGILTESVKPSKKLIRTKLIQSKILKKHGENYIFSKDYDGFTSVSDAATQIAGSPRDGNKTWKLPGTNTTYGEWKESVNGKTKK